MISCWFNLFKNEQRIFTLGRYQLQRSCWKRGNISLTIDIQPQFLGDSIGFFSNDTLQLFATKATLLLIQQKSNVIGVLLLVVSVTPFKIDQNKKSKPFYRISPESGNRKEVDMQSLSQRFRSQQFFLWKIRGETFSPNL